MSLFLALSQAGLGAQSSGSGLMYSSYLPFGNIYNEIRTENSLTNSTSETKNFRLGKNDVTHYSPGGAISWVYALSGWMTSLDVGLMGAPGPHKTIPNFPVRPFIGFSFATKLINTMFVGIYGIGGFYLDLAFGEGRENYQFTHFMGFFRMGPGVSFRLIPVVELFVQVQLGIGIQSETITLESSAGNTLYDGTFFMVPVAIFPELGVRFWF